MSEISRKAEYLSSEIGTNIVYNAIYPGIYTRYSYMGNLGGGIDQQHAIIYLVNERLNNCQLEYD